MAGDVEALTDAIAAALDVEHGESGSREAIAQAIAQGVADWGDSLELDGTAQDPESGPLSLEGGVK